MSCWCQSRTIMLFVLLLYLNLSLHLYTPMRVFFRFSFVPRFSDLKSPKWNFKEITVFRNFVRAYWKNWKSLVKIFNLWPSSFSFFFSQCIVCIEVGANCYITLIKNFVYTVYRFFYDWSRIVKNWGASMRSPSCEIRYVYVKINVSVRC